MATAVHDYWNDSPSPRLVPDEDWEPSIRSGSVNDNDNEANFVVRDCAKLEYVSSSVRVEDYYPQNAWSVPRESEDPHLGYGMSSSRGNYSHRSGGPRQDESGDDGMRYAAHDQHPREAPRTHDRRYINRNVNVLLSATNNTSSSSHRDDEMRSDGYGGHSVHHRRPSDTYDHVRAQQQQQQQQQSRTPHAGVTPLVALAYAPSPSYDRSELDRSPEVEFVTRSARNPQLAVRYAQSQDQLYRSVQPEYVYQSRLPSNVGDRSARFTSTPLREAIDHNVPPIMHWDALQGHPAAHMSYAFVAPNTHGAHPASHVLIPTFSYPHQYALLDHNSQRHASQDAASNGRVRINSSPSPQPHYEEGNRSHRESVHSQTVSARQSTSLPKEKENRNSLTGSERRGHEMSSSSTNANIQQRQGMERLGARAVPSAPSQRSAAPEGRDSAKASAGSDAAPPTTKSSSHGRKESSHRRRSRSSCGSSRLSTTRTPETSGHAAHGRRSSSRATSSTTVPSSFVSALELAAAENEVENVKDQLQKKHAELAHQQKSFSDRVHEKVTAHDAENEDARHHQRREFQRSLEVLREENDELRAAMGRLEEAASPAVQNERIIRVEREWKQKVSQIEQQWERRLLDAQEECKEQVRQAVSAKDTAEQRCKELVASVQELEGALQSMIDEKENLSRSIAEQSLQRAREMDSLIVTPRDSQYATHGAPPLSGRSARSASGHGIVSGGGAAPASSSSSVAVIALEREVQQLRHALREATAFQDTLVTQIDIGGREVAMIDKNTDAMITNLKRELQNERRRSADLVKLYGSQIETLHRQLAEMTKKNQTLVDEVRRLEKIQSELLI